MSEMDQDAPSGLMKI